ncbi:hypothetical protein [Pseudaestuariivita rosea]|uniref:hypothetical protein n=1 Tax=Pseudaestuariivita rosea TaxID=2763263 RepID=UPI001ABA3FFA|nr:hypothetical protein [Pseudaestuariivita rosea]
MRRLIATMILTLALTACSQVQTTSGRDFVERKNPDGTQMQIDDHIAKIANVESNLHFPARIGVARIINGRLEIAPPAERKLMEEFAKRNKTYGSFGTVSALVAETVTGNRNNNFALSQIRVIAARQHFDYVLIYKIDGKFGATNRWDRNRVPANTIMTQVALIDVRNGYPYAATEAALSANKVRWGGGGHRASFKDRATYHAAEYMMPQVQEMFAQLKAQM